MIRSKIVATLSGCAATIATATLFAATLEVGNPEVVLMAGQTVEVPLSSEEPIASDLTASGAFQAGDVTFTAGPVCHLAHEGCTLMITAAPTSKNYTDVPVTVSESAATNTPVLTVTVINPQGSTANLNVENNSPPLMLANPKNDQTAAQKQLSSEVTPGEKNSPTPLQRSGNSLFYGVVEPHPGLLATAKDASNDFVASTNGPVYQIVNLTNHDTAQPLSVTISGPGASSFSLDDNPSDYGTKQNCAAINSIASGDSCLVIVKGKIGDPNQAPQTAMLTIQGRNNNVATFAVNATTYVYAAGGFDTLGDATVSGGDLLAECTAGHCANALNGATGDNYASTNSSVGHWINALRVTPAGNLLVGGTFGAIGGATSGSTTTIAAMLAQCKPGGDYDVSTNHACINQIGMGVLNPYVFNNGYIDAISPLFAISTTSYVALGGDFTNIRGFSVSAGQKMLAKCAYNSTTATATCNNYLLSGKYATGTISAVDYVNGQMAVGGLFKQIASYPPSAPLSGTTFATCTTSTCSQGMGSGNPHGSILGMATKDTTHLYMGGSFTQIGGYTDSGGGHPLVLCALGNPTSCANALSGSNDANGYIEGLAYSGGKLYVGGKFTTIGGATAVPTGNMLAECTPYDVSSPGSGTCSNFVTDTQNYASGSDWGGEIAAIAVGERTSITAN